MLKFGLKILIFVIDIFLGLAVFGFFFSLSWFFAHSILDGILVGNDSFFAISMIRWFDKFWPNVPLWFPRQGVGVSMLFSYPMLPGFVVLIISKLSPLSIVQVYRLLSFLIFPLTALGIYYLTKRLSRNWGAGIIAGVFFLLSQASWIFLRLHGIFAQTFSYIFVAPTWLFFDMALNNTTNNNKGVLTRLCWVLFSIFLTFAILSHPVTGVILIITLSIYAFVHVFLEYRKTTFKLKKISISLIYTFIFIAVGLGLSAFWLLPFTNYSRLANRDGFNTMNLSQLKEVSLLPKTLLGFNDFVTGNQRYDYFFFALPVLILFLFGFGLSLLRNKKLAILACLAIGALFYTTAPLYAEIFVKPFTYLFTAIYFRALVVPIIFIPIVAAGGLSELGNLIFGFLRLFFKKISPVFKFSEDFTLSVIVSLSVLIVGVFMIKTFPHAPPDKHTSEFPAYGIRSFAAYGPSLDIEWKQLLSQPELLFQLPNKIEISNDKNFEASAFVESIKDLQLGQFDRIDVSPNVLGGAIVKSDAVGVTDASIVNLYHYFASLTHGLWGYQQGVFFGSAEIYNDPILLAELTKWYGIKYVYNLDGWDRIDNYKNVGYTFYKKYGDGSSSFNVYSYPKSTSVVELSDKPVILVIGDYRQGAYDQVFRLANYGLIPYDQALIVEGSKNIDDYNIDELKQYRGLILHGYSYNSKNKADSLLKKYLETGGKVFVNTGWQYIAKDWGDENKTIKLPTAFPIRFTSWKSLPKSGLTEAVINSNYQGDYAVGKFSSLDWRGSDWGLASAKVSDLADDARAILTVGNDVLMAEKSYNQGKIYWSGINIFSHVLEYRNQDEIKFIKVVFSKLFDLKDEIHTYPIDVSRSYPDDVNFTISSSTKTPLWLLWKESYTPDWHLTEGNKNIKLQKAGPGFMLASIRPNENSKRLSLSYRVNFVDGILAKTISLISVVFIFIFIIFGSKVTNVIEKISQYFVKRLSSKFTYTLNKEEKDY